MGHIRVLPEALANQIAAGEVVERPVSALKELVENSLDAGSTWIKVTLERGGKKRIRVEDNGKGMDKGDCLMAFERHATSKLTRSEDLFSISTLGFRGEALPSIASVSRLSLESRTKEAEVGVRVDISGSKLHKVSEVPRNPGTAVTIDSLFFNIPARKKFLRTVETELSHMVNLMVQYSFAHIDKTFILEHDGRTLINVTPVKTLKERIYQHYGKGMLDDLVPVQGARDWLNLEGMISTPNLLKTSRQYQFMFVNGRLVKDRVLNHALLEAYKGFGEGPSYPVAFLFINVPSTEVDVNVHPAKTEVRFISSNFVHDGVRDACREALTSARLAVPYRFRAENHPQPSAPQEKPRLPWQQPQPQPVPPGADVPPPEPSAQTTAGQLPRDGAYQRFVRENPQVFDPPGPEYKVTPRDQQEPPQSGSIADPVPAPEIPPQQAEHQSDLFAATPNRPRPIGQFRESYILADDGDNLLLIDQHVAHERILYDQIKDALAKEELERQALVIPIHIELTPDRQIAMGEMLPLIRKFGFDLEPFDDHTWIVREMPTFVKIEKLEEAIGQLLDRAAGLRNEETAVEAVIDHFAATKACKAAVKINMRLTMEKMQHLIDVLWDTQTPLFCPHGRPIVLKFSNDEIERNFHRK